LLDGFKRTILRLSLGQIQPQFPDFAIKFSRGKGAGSLASLDRLEWQKCCRNRCRCPTVPGAKMRRSAGNIKHNDSIGPFRDMKNFAPVPPHIIHPKTSESRPQAIPSIEWTKFMAPGGRGTGDGPVH
jgi:hypothetical protein